MKKPKINDVAIRRGRFNIYGELRITKVMEKVDTLGYRCEGIYKDYKTGESNKAENTLVYWSKRYKAFRG